MKRISSHKKVYDEHAFNRKQLWFRVRDALRAHITSSPKGEAKRIANTLGIEASQVHRFECPECEHDQEPRFSTGFALLLYLIQAKLSPIFDLHVTPKWQKNQFTSHTHHARKGKFKNVPAPSVWSQLTKQEKRMFRKGTLAEKLAFSKSKGISL